MRALSLALFVAGVGSCAAEIAPQYLDFGSNGDVRAVTIDASGNLYAVGRYSTPEQPHIAQIRAIKLSPSNQVLYTYTLPQAPLRGGASWGGDPNAAAVDNSGALYIAGEAPCDQTTGGAQEVHPILPWTYGNAGAICGFLAKVNETGTALLLFTTLGNVSNVITANGYMIQLANNPVTSVNALAIDPTGSVYLTGATDAAAFPVTPNAYQTAGPYADPQTVATSIYVAFVVKIPATLDRLEYATFLSGYGNARSYSSSAGAIAVDTSGMATVTGGSLQGFPVTGGGFSQAASPYGTQFAARISPDGSKLVWSAVLPYQSTSNGSLPGLFVAMDKLGNVMFSSASATPPQPLRAASKARAPEHPPFTPQS
jgi:hypothetical protein